MLFKEQKREQVKPALKAKPGIMDLAEKVYAAAYPFSTEVNLDDLFEEMVTRYALQLGLAVTPNNVQPQQGIVSPAPVEELELTIEAGIENGDTIEVGDLLKG